MKSNRNDHSTRPKLQTAVQYFVLGCLSAVAVVGFLAVTKKSMALNFISEMRKDQNIQSDSQTGSYTHNERAPASLTEPARDEQFKVNVSKWAALDGFKEPDLRHMSKLRNPVQVEILATRPGPIKSSEIVTLRGVVRSMRDKDYLYVKWTLPDDVLVINGKKEDVLANLKSGEPQEIELTIQSNSDENRQIDLQAYVINSEGENSGNVAQFNTTKQEEISAELDRNWHKARAKVLKGKLKHIVQ